MRYRFIQAEKARYPVGGLCQVLGVARSGFYAWCRRPLSARAQQNQGLLTHIRACYQAARGRYGSPRIHQDLQARATIRHCALLDLLGDAPPGVRDRHDKVSFMASDPDGQRAAS